MIKPVLKQIPCMDLRQIADSGQCFRMTELSDTPGRFFVISQGHYLEIEQHSGRQKPEEGGSGPCPALQDSEDLFRKETFVFYCEEADLPFWERYFDLECDYSAYIHSVRKKDAYLRRASQAGSGIRILNQDPWEMILTFVISQQKTIPKIREAIEALSLQFGTEYKTLIPRNGQEKEITWHSFPTPSQLAGISEETLRSLKLGYRAKYIARLCQDAAEARLNLDALQTMNYEEAMSYLKGFYGIGEKVANCICLFGLHHIEAFPVDTWIEQILMQEYYRKKKKKYDALPKSRLYGEIIHDYFGMYQGYAGVMQQYIFYYERVNQGKVK